MELLAAGQTERAVDFARSALWPLLDPLAPAAAAASGQQLGDGLRAAAVVELMGLMAYEKPADSPLAHLLAPSRRTAVADVLNAALLAADSSADEPRGALPSCALEAALRQLAVVQHELRAAAGGAGPVFRLREALEP